MNASQNQTSGEFPKSSVLKPSWLAGKWCSSPAFWVFLNDRFPSADTVTNVDEAADLVRFLCCIQSRGDLDTDVKARQRFEDLFRKPYAELLASRAHLPNFEISKVSP